jgi:hypothetical protein
MGSTDWAALRAEAVQRVSSLSGSSGTGLKVLPAAVSALSRALDEKVRAAQMGQRHVGEINY